jgi:hypothetical protein
VTRAELQAWRSGDRVEEATLFGIASVPRIMLAVVPVDAQEPLSRETRREILKPRDDSLARWPELVGTDAERPPTRG